MTYVLGTSVQAVREAPLLLVDLETEEGVTGHAYQFCYLPAAAPAIVTLLEEVLRTVKGDQMDPVALWAKLAQRFILIGVQGIVRMAMAMFDVACWDAVAKAAALPDQPKQAELAGVIFFVGFKVAGQIFDAFRNQGDLHGTVSAVPSVF